MENGKQVCFRCDGRKKIFKIGGGYSHIDMGGQQVDCPMCLGCGSIKTLEAALEEKEELKSGESNKRKKADA
jgi:hypothetical protein